MAKLKNWVVTTDRIKSKGEGLVQYGAYLINPNHSNHKGRTSIIPMFGDINKFTQSTFGNCTQIDMQNTKGGRPMQSYAQSFCLELPPIFQPTEEQWRKIGAEVAKSVCKHLELDPSKFPQFGFANLHQQKNSHLNLVFSRAFNGVVLSKLDQKSTLVVVKKSFTEAVLKHCAIDVASYEVQTPTKRKKYRGRVPKWLYQLDQLENLKLTKEEIKSAKKEFAELIESADRWIKACREENEIQSQVEEENFSHSYNFLQSLNKDALNNRILNIRQTAENTAKKKFKI
jgi:hypothetical protein